MLHFAYGDGSVRSVKTNIDMRVFTFMATIGNGETIAEN
jgi:hypothetical protein